MFAERKWDYQLDRYKPGGKREEEEREDILNLETRRRREKEVEMRLDGITRLAFKRRGIKK
jgi:hypothetical protein